MGPNLLDGPVACLQKAQKPTPPWSFVARHLVALLKRYATGLSFEIAVEEITSSWRSHIYAVVDEGPNLFICGKILSIAPGPPEIWLVRLSDATLVAWFAHSSLERRFKPGTEISVSACDAVDVVGPGSGSEFLQLVHEAFQGISPIIESSPGALKSSLIIDPKRTPVKRSPEDGVPEANSQSPVDISKFHSRNEQHAITPSQAHDPNELTTGLKQVILPTPQVYVELDTIDHAAIGLLESPEAFTLQRVWNERSLTPDWVFASVVEVNVSGSFIRLQDPAITNTCDQPSVVWRIPPELKALTIILQPGFNVLLGCPMVEPTGSSFNLLSLPHTSCYYRRRSFEILQPVAGNNTVHTPRPVKRHRGDPDLSERITTVSTEELAKLMHPESQPTLTVHARVIAPPKAQSPSITLVACENDVVFRVAGSGVAQEATSFRTGDEALFHGVMWVPALDSFSSQTPAGWFAQSFDNLSVMSGFLYSSFTRRIRTVNKNFDITDQVLQNVTNCPRIVQNRSSCSAGTVQIFVQIHDVSLSLKERELLLSVRDASTSNLSQKIAISDKSGTQNLPMVVVRERCFEQLFRTRSAALFWSNDPEQKLTESLSWLKSESWLMTVSCNGPPSSHVPEVCACVPGFGTCSLH